MRIRIALGMCLFAPAVAFAANFNVNTTSDQVDFLPGNGICEATSGVGNCTLRAAIMETNALAGTHVVNIPSGTYLLTRDGTGSAAVGDLDIISSEVTLIGAGAASTILDANGIDRFFSIEASQVEIRDLTIQGGVTDADSNLGGAILVFPGNTDPNQLLLRRVHLLNNAANVGGAIRAVTESVVTIEESLIQGNETIAGIFNRTAAALYCQGCTMTLNSTTVTGNGDDFSPKVIEVDSNGQLNILNSTISGNLFGGGVRASNGNVSIKFSTLVNNGAQNLSFFTSGSHVFEVGASVLQSNSDNCQAGSLPVSLGYNIVGDLSCAFSAAGDLEETEANLGLLGNNGGATPTQQPQPGSPAVDHVVLAACTDLEGAPLTTDQRNSSRPFGSLCDAGAVEVSSPIVFEDGFEDL